MSDSTTVNKRRPSINLRSLDRRRRHLEDLTWALREYLGYPGRRTKWWISLGRGILAVGGVITSAGLLGLVLWCVGRLCAWTGLDSVSAVLDPPIIVGAALSGAGLVLFGLGLAVGIGPTYVVETMRAPPRLKLREHGRAAVSQLSQAFTRFQQRVDESGDRQRRVVAGALGEVCAPDVCQSPGRDALAIVTSRAWRDSWLDSHRLDTDPIREATEIYLYLGRVAEEVDALLAKADRHKGTLVGQTYRQYAMELTSDLSAIRSRVEALHNYRCRVDRLSQMMDAEDRLSDLEREAEEVRSSERRAPRAG